jgi:hypothetical protein
MIRERPKSAAGYVHLADALERRGRRKGSTADLERALATLQQALDRPVLDAEGFDVEHRMRSLREDLSG